MRAKRWWMLAAVAGLALQAACVGGSKSISAEDKERLKSYILESEPPDIAHKVDINFENRVHIIGYNIDPVNAKPGQDVKLTYYWRCDDRVDEGWGLFTHIVLDPATDHRDNLDNDGPLRELKNNKQILSPDKWEKGKIYVDQQTYKVPADIKSPELTVLTGVWKQNARLHIISGPTDGDNGAVIGKIKTGVAAAEEPHTRGTDLPSVTVNKLAAGDKIVIDGKADDKGWGSAALVGPFVDVGTGKPNTSFPVNGAARLTWDDTNMYVLFQVSDPDVVGYFTDKDKQKSDFTATGLPKLWTKDTVEIMTDPDGDGDNKDYYELQINPQNKVFHSQFDTYNAPKGGGDEGPFGHEDWDPKLKSAVTVQGTIDKPDDKDEGYTVEMAIPWAAFSKAAHHPPKLGDTWRMNFYAMKNNGGVAWSAILGQGNFHKATRFGRVTWGVAPSSPGSPGSLAAGQAGQAAGTGPDGGDVATAVHGGKDAGVKTTGATVDKARKPAPPK
ncbi:carbohydrate-binding family 9-like protein [Pendulispora albinea]|uniref:Carbohydrate-binding family 9-like protein n=1 Tax=Pendulispora albinea TaxID=2741071 RepID=A0ABZ2LLB9_9BACT